MASVFSPRRTVLLRPRLSDLVVRLDDGSDTAVAEVARLGAHLLFAGHETTVAAIDKGVLLLVANDLASTLRDRPDLVDAFVEEVLRLPLPVPHSPSAGATGLPRWATAPIELNGPRISPGELVLLDLHGANLDAGVFKRPDTLDLARAANRHLAFGHGPNFCLGAPLARLELRTLFGSLVRRFPALHLTVPIQELRPRSRLLTSGLQVVDRGNGSRWSGRSRPRCGLVDRPADWLDRQSVRCRFRPRPGDVGGEGSHRGCPE